MNAITLLKQDHRNVEALFTQYWATDDDGRRFDTATKLVEHLSVHAAIEEEVFYPAVSAALPDLEHKIRTSREEHHVMKWLLHEITKLPGGGARLDAKVDVLRSTVEHHVNEEETTVFPSVLEAVAVERLNEIGATLEVAKQHAPTRPHPRLSDEPPFNVIVDVAWSLVDRAVQTGRQAVSRVMHVGS